MIMWLGLALLAWAFAFAIDRICQAVKADAAARASIANATERAAAHNATRAQHEARRMELQLELSNNARAATKSLEQSLESFKANLSPPSNVAPIRRQKLTIVKDEQPPQQPDPAA
jgi:hypothetical protein